jgi:hypothetical protein
MQVLLKRSEEKKDIQCSVCRQGFRIFWERTSPAERDTMRAIVQGELVRHHDGDSTPAAHPAAPFNLPQWEGSPEFSGAALLGGGYSAVRPAFTATSRRSR